jgi:hypothetical protein
METGNITPEHLEIATVKEGNHTLAAEDISWWVSQIDFLWYWHVANFYQVILNCRHLIVVSEIGHLVQPYSQSSVEILLSTCSV